MNFNSLFIGSSSEYELIPVRRLISMHLSAKQKVIYIGNEEDWEQLMPVMLSARQRVTFISMPDSINLNSILIYLDNLLEELRHQPGMGISIYIKPANPGFGKLIPKWLKIHGISVHLILNEIGDLAWLDLPLYVQAFDLKCAFLWGKKSEVEGIGHLFQIGTKTLHQMWGTSPTLTAVRFDGMARLIDVAKLTTTRMNKQLAQLRAAAQIIMPKLALQHIPLGIYSVTDMLHAVTHIYVESPGQLASEIFVCYARDDAYAHQLAVTWGTDCFFLDELYFVRLPVELALWPFNLLGEVVDTGHCRWWCNTFSGEQREKTESQNRQLGGISI